MLGEARISDVGAATVALFLSAVSAAGGVWFCGDDPSCVDLAGKLSTNNAYPKGQSVSTNDVLTITFAATAEATTASAAPPLT